MSDRIFDTGTDDINTEVIDGVMRITLNRPDRWHVARARRFA